MQDKQRALRLIDVLHEELTRLFDESWQVISLDLHHPFNELRAWKAKAVSRIAHELSPFESENLERKEVSTIGIVGGLGSIFAREVDLYKDFLDDLASYIKTATTSFMPTGWDKIDRNIETTQYNLTTAQTTLDFQKIGLACRETLKDLAQEVFDQDRHCVTDIERLARMTQKERSGHTSPTN